MIFLIRIFWIVVAILSIGYVVINYNNQLTEGNIANKQQSNNKKTYKDDEKIVYKDWQVEIIGNEYVVFKTHGEIVWGHEFGWYKQAGECEIDRMHLSISSQGKEHKMLNQFIGEPITFNVEFPQDQSIQKSQIRTSLDNVFEFTPGLTIAVFSNFIKDNNLDIHLDKFNKIKITVVDYYANFFDVPSDNYSLDGFIAAKLKAEEICKDIKVNPKEVLIASQTINRRI